MGILLVQNAVEGDRFYCGGMCVSKVDLRWFIFGPNFWRVGRGGGGELARLG